MKKEGETKRDRFKRLAEARVNRICKQLQLLGNLGNRSLYECDGQDVEKIYAWLENELQKSKKRMLGNRMPAHFSLAEGENLE